MQKLPLLIVLSSFYVYGGDKKPLLANPWIPFDTTQTEEGETIHFFNIALTDKALALLSESGKEVPTDIRKRFELLDAIMMEKNPDCCVLSSFRKERFRRLRGESS